MQCNSGASIPSSRSVNLPVGLIGAFLTAPLTTAPSNAWVACHGASGDGRKRKAPPFVAKAPEPVKEKLRRGETTVNKVYSQIKREEQVAKKREELQAAAEQFSAEQPSWTLICQDVMDGLQSVIDHHGPARLIFADPPYNIGIDYGHGAKRDSLDDGEYMTWVKRWLKLCVKCLTDDGSLWVMIGDEYAGEYVVALKSIGLTIRSWVKWYETFGVNTANKFNRTSRHIFYCVRDPKRFVFNVCPEITRRSDRQEKYGDKRANPDGKLLDDVWTDIPRLTGTCKERIPDFPTQLPVAIVQRIVCCASSPGDLVVDPFNGSGTTGVASLSTHRKYIGIDSSSKWIDMADKRLKGVRP